jgi:hypothetical protein
MPDEVGGEDAEEDAVAAHEERHFREGAEQRKK